MNKIKRTFGKLMQRVIDWGMGNGLMQEEMTASGNDKVTKEMSLIARQAAAESCVLLKNDGALPFKKNDKIAVFGRCQLDWFYVGYGSGGDVNPPYRVSLMEGLENAGVQFDKDVAETYKAWVNTDSNKADHGWWGHWPMSHPEMPLKADFVKKAAEKNDTAVIVIGRAAGEDRENTLTPGSFYLTKEENKMLELVFGAFQKTIVLLNIGSIFDMSWAEEYKDQISSILIVWQGGMESGNAAADVLTGKVNPSGRLADTIAKTYEDYPSSLNFGGEQFNNYYEDIFVGYRYFGTFKKDRVLYPFGFGLSYTTFTQKPVSFEQGDGVYTVKVEVTNTGKAAGKETVMAFVSAPQGELGKAAKVLASFGKTKSLLPGEKEVLTLSFNDKVIASYDGTGRSGYKNAFVLEKGAYKVFVSDALAGEFTLGETKLVEQT
ncbi:MAG: glycoside hydrolase family 3 C-terminal domain-containing protein, partial [Clostridia bacterium]|nr:glycoside hydrolase family 3 C-terminal domain-containing protein [Clostridia bacterium]